MRSETGFSDGQELVPKVSIPSRGSIWIQGLALEHGCVKGRKLSEQVFTKIHHRVDLPASHGVLRVESETDSQHTQDSIGLGHNRTVFLPVWHAAKWEEPSSPLGAIFLLAKTHILVLEVSVE